MESAIGALANRGVIAGQLNRNTGFASNTEPVAEFSSRPLEDLRRTVFTGTLRWTVISKPAFETGLEGLLQPVEWSLTCGPNFPALFCIPRHHGERYTHKAQYPGY